MFFLFVSLIKSLTIAERGKTSEYVIISAESISSWTISKVICQFLKDTIFKTVGVNLTIIPYTNFKSDDEIPKKAIYVFSSPLSKKIYDNPEYDELRDEFEIISKSGNIVICGNTRGAIFGVYDFVEKFCNYRYYNMYMEVFGKLDKIEIPDNYHDKQSASFKIREPLMTELAFFTNPPSRLRVNGGDMLLDWWSGTPVYVSHASYVPLLKKNNPNINVQNYPDYFTYYDGKRHETSICYSNPTVLDIITKNFVEQVRTEQEKGTMGFYYEFIPFDGTDYCRCPKCQAKTRQYGDAFSGVQMEFLNHLCEAVRKANLKPIRLRTLAYLYAQKPPKNIKCDEWLYWQICPMNIDFGHPITAKEYRGHAELMDQVVEWKKITNHISWYDYTCQFAAPQHIFPNLHVVVPNIRYFHQYADEAYHAEDHYGASGQWVIQKPYPRLRQFMQEYKQWLICKTLWNVDINEGYVSRDFIDGYYGRYAAPYVQAFIDDLENYTNKYVSLVHCLGYTNGHYSREFVDHLRRLWDKAVNASLNEEDKRHWNNTVSSRTSIIWHQHLLFLNELKTNIEFTENRVGPVLDDYKADIMKHLVNELFIVYNIGGQECVRDVISGDNLTTFYNMQRVYTNYLGIKPNILKDKDGITCITSQLYSGRCGSLYFTNENTFDYLNSKYGIDCYLLESNHRQFLKYEFNNVEYETIENTTNQFSYLRTKDNCIITKKWSIDKNTLIFTSNFKPVASSTLHPIWRFVLSLGDATHVAYRWGGKGNWITSALRDDTEWEFFGNATFESIIEIVDPISKRGVKIEMINTQFIDNLVIGINKTSKMTTIHVYKDELKTNCEVIFKITPLKDVENVPIAEKEEKPEKSHRRVILYDFMLPISGSTKILKEPTSPTGRVQEISTGQMFYPVIPYTHSNVSLEFQFDFAFTVKNTVPRNTTLFYLAFSTNCLKETCDLPNNQRFYECYNFYDYDVSHQGNFVAKNPGVVQTFKLGYAFRVNPYPWKFNFDSKGYYDAFIDIGFRNKETTIRMAKMEFIELEDPIKPSNTPVPEISYAETECDRDPWVPYYELDPNDRNFKNRCASESHDDKDNKGKSKLSGGAIAAIVIVVLLVVVGVACGLVYYYFKVRKASDQKEEVLLTSI